MEHGDVSLDFEPPGAWAKHAVAAYVGDPGIWTSLAPNLAVTMEALAPDTSLKHHVDRRISELATASDFELEGITDRRVDGLPALEIRCKYRVKGEFLAQRIVVTLVSRVGGTPTVVTFTGTCAWVPDIVQDMERVLERALATAHFGGDERRAAVSNPAAHALDYDLPTPGVGRVPR